MSTTQKVLIAGGGTGGHLFPGIALAEAWRRRHPEGQVLFVGTAKGIETTAVPKAGFPLALLAVRGLRGQSLKQTLVSMLRLPWSLVQALALLWRERPAVAVSVGGYAAGPAVLAAWLLRVPCVVLEQNTKPGVTNRILGHLAKRVVVPLPTSSFAAEKVRVLGNPVRSDLLTVREQRSTASADGSVVVRSQAHEAERDEKTRPLLLVLGGSQGARALNEAVVALVERCAQEGTSLPCRILHQTGRLDGDKVAKRYRKIAALSDEAAKVVAQVEARPFIDAMAAAYASADLVLCRAGASTLAELTVCGLPSILVPFPHATDDHQTANAKALEQAGAAIHLPQTYLSASTLLEQLQRLLLDPNKRKQMAARAYALGKPDCAQAIVTMLEEEVLRVSR